MSEDANEGVRVQPAERCLLCATVGERLYAGLRDRLFDAPGEWSSRRCPRCGLVWLDPRPLPSEIFKLYRGYYTHASAPLARFAAFRRFAKDAVLATAFGYHELGAGWLSRLLGRATSAYPPQRDRVGMSIGYLERAHRGRLRDVGCGNGSFLLEMRRLGWEIQGVEIDPEAVGEARAHDVPVVAADLERANFGDASFDAVVINHVIEHVLEPIALLAECRRVLRAGGRLVILTPNADSLGHRRHRRFWWALDPPRHLFLFSASTLAVCAERVGLEIVTTRSSPRLAHRTWTASDLIQKTGIGPPRGRASTLSTRAGSAVFQALEDILVSARHELGEELVLVSTKR